MTKQEYDAVVADAVKNGADKKDAEAYVTSGYKLPVDDKGNAVFEKAAPAVKDAPAKKGKAK